MNQEPLEPFILTSAKAKALEELVAEEFRKLVDEEKARILSKRNQSLWQRLINKLPFTVTRRKP